MSENMKEDVLEALSRFVQAGRKLNQAKKEYREAGAAIAAVSDRYGLAIAPSLAQAVRVPNVKARYSRRAQS